jgi:hypothetical protein
MRRPSLFAVVIAIASPVAAQSIGLPTDGSLGHHAQSGQFTMANGITIHYTAYDVNSNNTVTFYLVGGGIFTYVIGDDENLKINKQ